MFQYINFAILGSVKSPSDEVPCKKPSDIRKIGNFLFRLGIAWFWIFVFLCVLTKWGSETISTMFFMVSLFGIAISAVGAFLEIAFF